MPAAGGAPELVKGLESIYPSRYFDVADQIYFLDQESAPRVIRRYGPATQVISPVGEIDRQLVRYVEAKTVLGRYCLRDRVVAR
jgi:hypothetical protein